MASNVAMDAAWRAAMAIAMTRDVVCDDGLIDHLMLDGGLITAYGRFVVLVVVL